MAIELTTDNVIGALMRAVASKPQGYIYTNYEGKQADRDSSVACHYVHTVDGKSECGCIVGAALNDLGVPLDILVGDEGQPAFAVLMNLEQEGILTYDSEVSAILDAAQASQDTGETWQNAVIKAIKYAI